MAVVVAVTIMTSSILNTTNISSIMARCVVRRRTCKDQGLHLRAIIITDHSMDTCHHRTMATTTTATAITMQVEGQEGHHSEVDITIEEDHLRAMGIELVAAVVAITWSGEGTEGPRRWNTAAEDSINSSSRIGKPRITTTTTTTTATTTIDGTTHRQRDRLERHSTSMVTTHRT